MQTQKPTKRRTARAVNRCDKLQQSAGSNEQGTFRKQSAASREGRRPQQRVKDQQSTVGKNNKSQQTKSKPKTDRDVHFLPLSGLVGSNIAKRMDKKVCSWWNGPCLFEVLDGIEIPLRDPEAPVRMPVIDKYKDMGIVLMGKIESGTIHEGDSLLIMPNKTQVKVLAIYCDENKKRRAGPGENVRVKVSGVEEEDILSGFVLSSVGFPVSLPCVSGKKKWEPKGRGNYIVWSSVSPSGARKVSAVDHEGVVSGLRRVDGEGFARGERDGIAGSSGFHQGRGDFSDRRRSWSGRRGLRRVGLAGA
ncbi:hypothetical protein KSP40_PGU022566 [Platanthera guangdongensis]|uniref:Translation elongation factor EFTu-like domain-containing protein n=1 Tax=Platanthera guangdongensis TaxID=2320717 RepID=A0ABR2MSL3_9ASPA